MPSAKLPISTRKTFRDGKLAHFFRVAFRDFLRVGTLFPSSRWTGRTIAKQIPKGATCVVEYGPGNGAVTRHLIEHVPFDGRVIGVELNPAFIRSLSAISDRRFQVVQGNVTEWSARLKEWQVQGVDAVICGIPFTFLSSPEREAIVKNTAEGLRPGGRMILYQKTLLMKPVMAKYFSSVSAFLEPRNIFPYFIMVATKA